MYIYLNAICSILAAEVKSYFDTHAHHHSYRKQPSFYSALIDYVKKISLDQDIRILDVGCGDGSFIKGMIINGLKASFVGSDISPSMINIAKENLSGQKVELFTADGFKLPLKSEVNFDLIHIDSVLHHLIGKTRAGSLDLANKMIRLLINRLSENGILVVEETYYNSYFIPQITSTIVFHGLKLLNFLHLDVSKVIKEFEPGLEVNFLYEEEIKKLLKLYAETVNLIIKDPVKVPKLFRCFFLKDFGHISYIATVNIKLKSV